MLQAGAAQSDAFEYAVGRTSGTLALERAADPGPGPFTDPVAVDLALDPLLLPLVPLNGAAIVSPHHRNSAADALAAGTFGHRLVALERAGTPLTVAAIDAAARDTIAMAAVLEGVVDADGDDLDDDGRFTLTSLDGSSVCVSLPVPRRLAMAQGIQLDSGVPASGYSWTSEGPCGSAGVRVGSDVLVGTTPGVYGASRSGEVCDVAALRSQLEEDARVAEAWAMALGVEPAAAGGYIDGLTPVVVLRDTAVMDHLLITGRIVPRSAVLERGTAVLVDPKGVPRVRCVSGSPLRTAAPIPSGVVVEGAVWDGFSLSQLQTLPAALQPTGQFVLVDVETGLALHRASGINGSLARLAGPLYPADLG